MARLIITSPEGTQTVELAAVNSLGRHPVNTIQLLDTVVSKEHCVIEARGAHFVLRDLGSRNGTWVNDVRVNGERVLVHGDEVALGGSRARFEAPEVAANAAPSTRRSWRNAGLCGVAPGGEVAGEAARGLEADARTGEVEGLDGGGPGPSSGSAPGSSGSRPASVRSPAIRRASSGPLAPLERVPPGPTPHVAPPPVRAGGSPPPAPPSRGTVRPAERVRSRSVLELAAFQPPSPTLHVAYSADARPIDRQIDAVERGFVPFDEVAADPLQLRADYERLRLAHELTQAIGLEDDTAKLLDKILTSILRFIQADRAVIFLRDELGDLALCASQRRDGSTAPITVSSTILDHVVRERAAVLTHDAASDFAASSRKSMILNRISSAIVAPMLQKDDTVLGVLWLDAETLARFQPKDLELVKTIANQAARFIEIHILGRKVEAEIVSRDRLSRLLSPNLAERVISGQLEVRPGGQRVEACTVFNSDIRGFTRMSESTSPEALVDMLNAYFERMVDTLFKFEGTLDKFMGDGLMALWGAPVQTPEDAIRAVDCALEMGEVLAAFNAERVARGEAPLSVGVGIHTGPLVAGYIGSSKALSYTVIGDTANTSARLCAIALPGQILVSESTLERLGDRFAVEELPAARVKGKEHPLRVYNVLRRVAP